MGKTVRGFPHDVFRRPRGQRQALARGDRAVPPSAYDDVSFGREHYSCLTALKSMRRRGWPEAVIRARLATKFRLDAATISRLFRGYPYRF